MLMRAGAYPSLLQWLKPKSFGDTPCFILRHTNTGTHTHRRTHTVLYTVWAPIQSGIYSHEFQFPVCKLHLPNYVHLISPTLHICYTFKSRYMEAHLQPAFINTTGKNKNRKRNELKRKQSENWIKTERVTGEVVWDIFCKLIPTLLWAQTYFVYWFWRGKIVKHL